MWGARGGEFAWGKLVHNALRGGALRGRLGHGGKRMLSKAHKPHTRRQSIILGGRTRLFCRASPARGRPDGPLATLCDYLLHSEVARSARTEEHRWCGEKQRLVRRAIEASPHWWEVTKAWHAHSWAYRNSHSGYLPSLVGDLGSEPGSALTWTDGDDAGAAGAGLARCGEWGRRVLHTISDN